ncbi:MAG: hypothetical protein JRC90_08155 [Deltaproteobacteria bacterium]|nr:hypothetical protein [Deltaproteobacteria bacterium]
MPAEIRETIRGIENEAEKLIEKARADAKRILENANKKVGEILSAEIVMDEVRDEHDRIISGAKQEAGRKIEESRKASGLIRSDSSAKIDNFSQLMADSIRGIN